MRKIEPIVHLCRTSVALWGDVVEYPGASVRSQTALAAETLFLRKQLALYRKRKARSKRVNDATRLDLVLLARCFAWKEPLTSAKPETVIR
jgi:hypothetical protein